MMEIHICFSLILLYSVILMLNMSARMCLIDPITHSIDKLMPTPCKFSANRTIHFSLSLYVFLHECLRRRVGPWKLSRQRSLWWLDPGGDYKRLLLEWSRSSPDGWILIEGRSCLWRLVYVWSLILVLLMDELLDSQFLSQVRIFLLQVFCWH